MSTIKVDSLQTTGGAGLYPVRVFAHWSMSGTIYNSSSVSSLSDNGTGDHTVNYSVTLPNAGSPLAAGMHSKTNAIGAKTGNSTTTTSTRVYSGFWDNSSFVANDAPYVQLHVLSE